MKNFYPRLDPETGRFLPIPPGKKPPKMIAMENKLGVKFKNDYKKLYLSREIGQKTFARRWNVSNKSLIFSRNPNASRRSWVQMLNLPLRDEAINLKVHERSRFYCEICGKSDVSLDKAHWIERIKGGSKKSFNILNLCPNCHRKLDRNDSSIIEITKEVLLAREVQKIVKSKKDEKSFRKSLVKLCESIINRATQS